MNSPQLLLCAVALLCAACTRSEKKIVALRDPLLTNRDTTIAPSENFFMYANGAWFNRNPIPESESENGIFRTIKDTINAQVRKICEQAATANGPQGSNKQKIGDFYAAGMDSVSVDAAGISPLSGELQKIDDIDDVLSLMMTFGHLNTVGTRAGFRVSVGQDQKISSKHALYFGQGGLGLGNRDYYFNTDTRTVDIRKKYAMHVQSMLGRLGANEPTAATRVIKIETDLAKASRKLEATRDPVTNYNKMTVSQFNKLTPAIDWYKVLPSLGIATADTVIVRQPEFYQALSVLVKKYPISDWKLYLRWHLINEYANNLDTGTEQEHFNFYSSVLNGMSKQRPRWKRVVAETDGYLGELIGQVYVDEYLPKGTKEKLMEIGLSIRDVFAGRIRELDWMGDTTKAKALEKLNKIVFKVGYPDHWRDMSALEVDRSSYCANVMRANAWFYDREVRRLGRPVDRSEWPTTPQTYDAYYISVNNQIIIPACNIFVPGFEGIPDDAVVYGIIGGIFGHELTHGFDDQGSQYDANGNLASWWTTEDRNRFVEKTNRIVRQFSEFSVDSVHVNGDATQGENIADLGGAVMGYEAFKKTEQYKNNVIVSGMTPDERYFLACAYAWLVNAKKESIIRQIMTDYHSPAEFRVNGPLSNMPEFHKAFGVKNGDPMFRPDSVRVAIW
jgi:putative endopeptidase